MPPERENAWKIYKPPIAAAYFMVNKVFNTLCSGGISTETQIKITARDSSMQSFFLTKR